MIIGKTDLAKEVFLIAEIGNNHEGDFSLACEMIHLAADAGAHAVKFQTIAPEKLVSAADGKRVSQLDRFRFSPAQFEELSGVARDAGVYFLSTPFHRDAVSFLDRLVSAFKIASGDNDFFPLIDVVLDTAKPVIVSTGLTSLSDIVRTRDYIREGWAKRGVNQDLALLHCVVSYPTESADANLRVISTLAGLGETVGYSDHTLGIEAAVLSVALGARIVEKHFTIDKEYSDFRDHRLSADPGELAELSRRIREATVQLGNPEKSVSDAERPAMESVRRGIVAGRDLGTGHVIRFEDLSWVRPRRGLRPGEEFLVVGRELARSVQSGEPILPGDLKTKDEG